MTLSSGVSRLLGVWTDFFLVLFGTALRYVEITSSVMNHQ